MIPTQSLFTTSLFLWEDLKNYDVGWQNPQIDWSHDKPHMISTGRGSRKIFDSVLYITESMLDQISGQQKYHIFYLEDPKWKILYQNTRLIQDPDYGTATLHVRRCAGCVLTVTCFSGTYHWPLLLLHPGVTTSGFPLFHITITETPPWTPCLCPSCDSRKNPPKSWIGCHT